MVHYKDIDLVTKVPLKLNSAINACLISQIIILFYL